MTEASAEDYSSPFVRLDFPGRGVLYTGLREVIETREPGEVRACFERLRDRDAAGFIAYEAGHALEPKLAPLASSPEAADPPLLWFGMFEEVGPAPPLPDPEGAWAGTPAPGISYEAYAAGVERVRDLVAEGDVYQVNLTFPCAVRTLGSPAALYAQLRSRSNASWSALVFTGTHWLLSCSPELFFKLERGVVTCRPMKGTALAGSDPEVLRNDPKNRAENLMIVDLVRNDLSRVSLPGSVKVPELFTIEEYPTVLQMTSTVTGRLRSGLDAIDVLQSTFPCGSVTGAPKIRAMERIHELEKSCPRGPYTGSIGYVAANGDAEFNVAIRTLVLRAESTAARLDVGSGIVFDSDPASEWDECLQKAAFVRSPAAFDLFETLAWGPEGNPLVRLHVDRLQRSAAELEFDFDRCAAEAELKTLRGRLNNTVRLKITLGKTGGLRFDTSPVLGQVKGPLAVSLAQRTAAPDDFRLRHKTSDRSLYDRALANAGTAEVLFVDREGFLTEGSFTNVFVRAGTRLLTPPLRRGLLPGVLRRHLIDTGEAAEADLRPTDLEQGFLMGNSLRGLTPAVLSL